MERGRLGNYINIKEIKEMDLKFDRFLEDIGYMLYMKEQQEKIENDRNLKSKYDLEIERTRKDRK